MCLCAVSTPLLKWSFSYDLSDISGEVNRDELNFLLSIVLLTDASGGLTKSKWESLCAADGTVDQNKSQEVFRLVYFGGIADHEIRKQVRMTLNDMLLHTEEPHNSATIHKESFS